MGNACALPDQPARRGSVPASDAEHPGVALACVEGFAKALRMEIFIPLLVGATLIWLIGRGVPWNAKLLTLAVTLAVIVVIVLLERSGSWPEAFRSR